MNWEKVSERQEAPETAFHGFPTTRYPIPKLITAINFPTPKQTLKGKKHGRPHFSDNN